MKINLPGGLSQKELFSYLVANKGELIDCKKSAIKHADASAGLSIAPDVIGKAAGNAQDTDSVLYRTLVGNTYNWMDSHDDVHLDNIFGTSIKERGAARIYHRHDHVPQLTAKVGKFSSVYEQAVKWTDLGVNKAGQTMALLADSAIKRSYNQLIFDSYKEGEIDQHSVGMRYVKLFLAVNDEDYKEEFATWQKYFPVIGNQDKALEKGFFWAVKEAQLIEISCVTEGSNELTGIYNPSKDSITSANNKPAADPPASSQQQPKTIYSLLAS